MNEKEFDVTICNNNEVTGRQKYYIYMYRIAIQDVCNITAIIFVCFCRDICHPFLIFVAIYIYV